MSQEAKSILERRHWRISPIASGNVHYVHKGRNTLDAFAESMCKYVAIFVFKGLIEDVSVFDMKEEAARWLSGFAEEYGADNCADSIIWDTEQKTRIDLGFVSG